MKKIITIMILLMTISLVSAQTGNGKVLQYSISEAYQSQNIEAINNQFMNNYFVSIKHAYGNVTYSGVEDYNQFHMMNQQMENLNFEHRQKLQLMKQLEVMECDDDNINTCLKTREQVKLFGLFNMEKNSEFLIEGNNLVRKKGMFDWAYLMEEI